MKKDPEAFLAAAMLLGALTHRMIAERCGFSITVWWREDEIDGRLLDETALANGLAPFPDKTWPSKDFPGCVFRTWRTWI